MEVWSPVALNGLESVADESFRRRYSRVGIPTVQFVRISAPGFYVTKSVIILEKRCSRYYDTDDGGLEREAI
jgi:hypothetical protein